MNSKYSARHSFRTAILPNTSVCRKLYAVILCTFVLGVTACERSTESGTFQDGIPPAIPVGLTLIFARDGEVAFSWKANIEPDFIKYQVFRSTDSLTFSLIAETSRNYFFDDSLEYAKRYHYKVVSVDEYGQRSLHSECISGTPVNLYPPKPPLFVDAFGQNLEGNTSFYIEWVPGNESDIASYEIYVSSGDVLPIDSSHRVGLSNNPWFRDTTFHELLKTRYYKVIAVDKGGLMSAPSSAAKDMILPLPVLLSPPAGFIVEETPVFEMTGIPVRAEYQISVQEINHYIPAWAESFTPAESADIIRYYPRSFSLEYNRVYTWRAAVFTKSRMPNAVTPVIPFFLRYR